MKKKILAILLVAMMVVSILPVSAFAEAAAEEEVEATCPGEGKTHTLDNCTGAVEKETVEGNCVEWGYTLYECGVCDSVFADDFVKPNGKHEISEETLVPGVAPDCTNPGTSDSGTCGVCGEEIAATPVAPLGHKWATEGTPCETEDGKCGVAYDCERCDAVNVVEGEHVWAEIPVILEEPGYYTWGEAEYTCEACGATKVVPIRPEHKCTDLEHVAAVPATCEKEGNIEYWQCKECKVIYSDAALTKVVEDVVVPALGHDFGESNVALGSDYTTTIVPSPSYPDEGGDDLTDGRYGDSADAYDWVGFNGNKPEVVIDLGKVCLNITEFKVNAFNLISWGIRGPKSVNVMVSVDGINWTNAGESDSYTSETTEVCNYTVVCNPVNARYVKFILNNNANWTFVSELEVYAVDPVEYVPSTCTKNGYYVVECANGCGKTQTTELPLAEHTYSPEPILAVAPTCTTFGFELYACVNCAHIEKVEKLDPLGHSAFEDGLNQDELLPGCESDGYRKWDCARCGEAQEITLKATGHKEVTVEVDPTCYMYGYTFTYCANDWCVETVETSVQVNDGDNKPILNKHGEVADFDVTVDGNGVALLGIAVDVEGGFDPDNHTRDNSESYYLLDPTCTETGTDVFFCLHCNFYDILEVPATGHDYEFSYTANKGSYTVDAGTGNASYDHAYGYEFKIDDVNGKIGGEDSTICTTQEAYNACNPNWAITIYAVQISENVYYVLRDAIVTPGSAANANIEVGNGRVAIVFHSSSSNPTAGYANWEDKVAAIAVKAGDCLILDGVDVEAGTTRNGTALCVMPALNVKSEATCEKDMVITFPCNNGCGAKNDVTVTGSALGHDTYEVIVPPTCDDEGYTEVWCTHANCDQKWNTKPLIKDEVAPLANKLPFNSREEAAEVHDQLGSWTVLRDGDCETVGLEVATCGRCGLQVLAVIDNTGNGHVAPDAVINVAAYDDWNAHAAGVVAFTAQPSSAITWWAKVLVEYDVDFDAYRVIAVGTNGGDENNNWTIGVNQMILSGWSSQAQAYAAISALKLGDLVTVDRAGMVLIPGRDVTCLVDGYTAEYTCLLCGELVKSEVIKAKGEHTKEIDVDAKAPTCTEDGATEGWHCTECDYKVVSTVLPATGHGYNGWKVVINMSHYFPTCTDFGFTHATCNDCGREEIWWYNAALDHDFSDVEVPVGCLTDGLLGCTRCDETKVVKAEGHVNAAGDKFGFCDQTTPEDAVCVNCTDSESVAHRETVTTTVDPTCVDYGYYLTTCTACDWHTMVYIEELADHKVVWDDEKYVAPTFHAAGSKTGTCSVCKGEFTEEVKALEGLGYFVTLDNAVVSGAELVDSTTLAVTIAIDGNNAGVWGVRFNVEYDAAVLKFDSSEFVCDAYNVLGEVNDNNGYVTVVASLSDKGAEGVANATVNAETSFVVLYFTVATNNKVVEDSAINVVPVETIDAEGKAVATIGDSATFDVAAYLDANEDGAVNLADALYIYNIVSSGSGEYDASVDVDKDGVITLFDFIAVYKFLSGEFVYADMVNGGVKVAPQA